MAFEGKMLKLTPKSQKNRKIKKVIDNKKWKCYINEAFERSAEVINILIKHKK